MLRKIFTSPTIRALPLVRSVASNEPSGSTWQLPLENYAILNTDGAVFDHTFNPDGSIKETRGFITCGGIIRNHKGKLLVCFTSKLGLHKNVIIPELYAARIGFFLIKSLKIRRLKFESDSDELIKHFAKPLLDYESYEDETRKHLFEETSRCWSELESGDYRFHQRFGNRPANLMCKYWKNEQIINNKDVYDDPDLHFYDGPLKIPICICKEPLKIHGLKQLLEDDLKSATGKCRW